MSWRRSNGRWGRVDQMCGQRVELSVNLLLVSIVISHDLLLLLWWLNLLPRLSWLLLWLMLLLLLQWPQHVCSKRLSHWASWSGRWIRRLLLRLRLLLLLLRSSWRSRSYYRSMWMSYTVDLKLF